MDRERVKLNAIWSLHLQVHWRNRHWLSPGLLFKHTCKCGSYATAHSVHERDGGFCEGKAEAGRDLDEVGGGGGEKWGQRARRNCTLPVFPDFTLMFDCKKWFAHFIMRTKLVCKDIQLHCTSTPFPPHTQCPKQKTVFYLPVWFWHFFLWAACAELWQ